MVAFQAFKNLFSGFREPAGPIDNKPFSYIQKGTSGTELYSKQFDEEYLSKLYAEKGIEVFDEMRRSDGQVKMLLSVVKNPIKSASWAIDPAEEGVDEEEEIAEFVRHVLFSDISTKDGKRKTFMEFLHEVLTCIEFGHSVFEVVHKNVKGHKKFGNYLGIADLGFRHQRSIIEWGLRPNGTIDHVRQMVHGDLQVDTVIPGQHLLVFSIEKEGDNYAGISMLRPCYGAWFRKNIYRKLQAIGIERAAKGVPIGTTPPEAVNRPDYQQQLAAFQDLIDKLCAHQKNGIVLGAGFDVKELKLSHDADKVQSTIDGEDNEMARAFVAGFMMLGSTGNSGSFALGTDLSAIFLAGIQNIGYAICERLNLDLIEAIVKAKYGERDKYPKLTVSGIADKAGKVLAEILSSLIAAGAVQKSTALQRHVHKRYDLPEVDEEIAAREQEAATTAHEAVMNPPDDPEGEPPAGGKADPKDAKKKLHEGCGHEYGIRLTDDQKAAHPVSAFIEAKADSLTRIMRTGLHARSAAMLHEMTRQIRAGGDETEVRRAVLAVAMPDAKDYASELRAWASTAVQQALTDVLAELGKPRRGFRFADEGMKILPKEKREKLVQTILLTAGYQDDDIEKAVYFAFNEAFGRDDTETVIAAMGTAVERHFEKTVIETAAHNMAAKVTNGTRGDVFFSPEIFDDVESFIFMNPVPETAICRSLVGRVFTKEEYQSSGNVPPLHHNCDSYVVAQTVGAAGNRPLTPGGLAVTDPAVLKTKTL